MLNKLAITICAVAMSAATLGAQARSAQTATAAKPAADATKSEPAAAKAPPEPAPLPYNIRIEVVITDQAGPGDSAKKTVSMIVGDRQSNSIRTSAQVRQQEGSYRNVNINVDARPTINPKEPNKLLLSFGLEYQPKAAGASTTADPNYSNLSQRLSLNLESGKPLLVSQAADPTSDRKITVEVTATILK
jgi:glucose/arabinose dehydrogenase